MHVLKKIIILPLLALGLTAAAQDASECFYQRNVHEVGIGFGATYYMGDFNPNFTPLLSPHAYGSAFYRYNFKQYFSVRGQVGAGYIKGDPANISDPPPGVSAFKRPWAYVEAMMEFKFLPYNPVNLKKRERFTPMLMVGIGAFTLSRDLQPIFDIPVGVGVKWCVASRLSLGAEWLWRITFYDKIDNYTGVDPNHNALINNDWIGTLGITLSYHIKQTIPCHSDRYKAPKRRDYKGILHQ